MISKFPHFRPKRIAFAALTGLLMLPLANAQTTQPGMGTMKPGMAASAPMGSGNMGMKDMKTMMGSMSEKMTRMPMSGNPDVDFAAMMRIHHEGAISMAEAQLKDGKNAEMRTLAKNIIAAQKKEIAQLDKFLTKQGHSVDKMTK